MLPAGGLSRPEVREVKRGPHAPRTARLPVLGCLTVQGRWGFDASTSAIEAEEQELLRAPGVEGVLVVPPYEFAILECLHCSSCEPSQPSFFIYTLQPVDALPG